MAKKKNPIPFLGNDILVSEPVKKEPVKKEPAKKEIPKKEITIPLPVKEYTAIVPTIQETEYVKYYINYFAIKKLINGIVIIPPLKKFLLQKYNNYCQWFNNKFNTEVKDNGR